MFHIYRNIERVRGPNLTTFALFKDTVISAENVSVKFQKVKTRAVEPAFNFLSLSRQESVSVPVHHLLELVCRRSISQNTSGCNFRLTTVKFGSSQQCLNHTLPIIGRKLKTYISDGDPFHCNNISYREQLIIQPFFGLKVPKTERNELGVIQTKKRLSPVSVIYAKTSLQDILDVSKVADIQAIGVLLERRPYVWVNLQNGIEQALAFRHAGGLRETAMIDASLKETRLHMRTLS